MKAVLQVMLKASIIVPLSGTMVHCRGLTLVGGLPLLFPGNILVGRGAVGLIKESVVEVGSLTVGCVDLVFIVYSL